MKRDYHWYLQLSSISIVVIASILQILWHSLSSSLKLTALASTIQPMQILQQQKLNLIK